MSILSKKYFYNEKAALEYVESIVWPDGPVCAHCGESERVNKLEGVKDKKGCVRHGLYKCYNCRKQFTVRVNTVFQSSHIPLHKWLQCAYLMCSSKKGISAHQLHRTLEVTYKTAWFMAHRLREAMRDAAMFPMGGDGKTMEVDETFLGKSRVKHPKARGYAHKQKVLTLVERGGKARSIKIDRVDRGAIMPLMREHIDRDTKIMTDDAAYYKNVGKFFKGHESVCHSTDEWVRGEAHTNTIEGFFSIFKRGMRGIYQHCAERHLHRYLAEFDFRYNNRGVDDMMRTVVAVQGTVGKRLMYRDSLKAPVM